MIAPKNRAGHQVVQKRMGQTKPVGQFIDTGALSRRCAIEHQYALVGYCAQKTLCHLTSLALRLGFQLPV